MTYGGNNICVSFASVEVRALAYGSRYPQVVCNVLQAALEDLGCTHHVFDVVHGREPRFQKLKEGFFGIWQGDI